jgi:hypothetical protein
MSGDYSHDLMKLKMAIGGMVRGYAAGGDSTAPQGPTYLPGIGLVDPTTGAPLPMYLAPNGSASNGMPQGASVGQQYMPQAPQGQSATPQTASQLPQTASQLAQGAGSASPSGSAGSSLTSALANPAIGALLGAGLGAIGGGGKGALAGAALGPMLGSNVSQIMQAAHDKDPSTSLAALSARYLPLLAASYAGAFYKNPTAPTSYGRPSSQNQTLADVTPKSKPQTNNSWYTYGSIPDYTGGHAAGGAIHDPMSPMGSLSQGVAAPGETGQRFVDGPGDGTSDDVNAKLSDGEYVFDAGTTAMLGNGSSKAGAQKLDKMRENIRKDAGKKMVKGKQFMKSKNNPMDYMGGDS